MRGARILGPVSKRPGRTLLVFAALAVVTAVSLFVSVPWKRSPGFLERAQGALAPAPGTILHVKWELTTSSIDLGCAVTHGPNAVWIDQTPPHRYRVLLNEHVGAADLRALVCSGGTATELGRTFYPGPMSLLYPGPKARQPRRFDPGHPRLFDPGRARRPTLRFVPPNTLSYSYGNWPFYFEDPVRALRRSLDSGRAHDEGTMQLDGRTVRRIRIDPPTDYDGPRNCPGKPTYAYVDPDTFYPI